MLKFLFKLTLFGSLVLGLFIALYLQEISVTGNQLERACAENGVLLPLRHPRLEVDVSNLTMTLYEGDTRVRRYDIAVGENRQLGMLTAGAESTPTGEYKVIRKAKREDMFVRGSRFLQINFPSLDDLEHAFEIGMIDQELYQECYRAAMVGQPYPDELPIGHTLGIQGNHFVINGSHSTDGSVALRNADINELYEHIPLGTPVIIKQ